MNTKTSLNNNLCCKVTSRFLFLYFLTGIKVLCSWPRTFLPEVFFTSQSQSPSVRFELKINKVLSLLLFYHMK